MPADPGVARQRLLLVAAAAFAEVGLEATQADIATRAGVGVATIYRRFANKDDLIRQVYEAPLWAAVEQARRAEGAANAWQGFVEFVQSSAENLARDRGLRDLVLGGFGATFGWARGSDPRALANLLRDTDAAVSSYLSALIARAQHDGDLRDDFEVTDVQLVTAMIQAAATLGWLSAPQLHQRAITFVLDGLRAARATPSIPKAPALTHDQLDQLMRRSTSDGTDQAGGSSSAD